MIGSVDGFQNFTENRLGGTSHEACHIVDSGFVLKLRADGRDRGIIDFNEAL